MAYSSDTNTIVTEFINRAQTRIGVTSTLIADMVSKGARRESYQSESEESYFLNCFIRSLDSNFNTWTEAEVVKYVNMWNAKARLVQLPYFEHEQYNVRIVFTNVENFIPSGNINMLGFKIVNLGSGTASGDAVNKSQLDTKVSKAGDSMTGPLAMGSQKITGLAAATQNGDAVRYEQIPTGLPPSGPAGGDLSGTYPNPAVNDDSHQHTPGVSIPAYPAALPPNGSAGGVLGGSYPNPTWAAGDVALGGKKITQVNDGSSATDAVTVGQMETADDLRVNKTGDTMTGPLAMSSQKITGLDDGTDPADAINKGQLDDAISGISGCISIADAVYAVLPANQRKIHNLDNIAARTITLPQGSTVIEGVPIWLKDSAYTADTAPITVELDGPDLFEDGVSTEFMFEGQGDIFGFYFQGTKWFLT